MSKQANVGLLGDKAFMAGTRTGGWRVRRWGQQGTSPLDKDFPEGYEKAARAYADKLNKQQLAKMKRENKFAPTVAEAKKILLDALIRSRAGNYLIRIELLD